MGSTPAEPTIDARLHAALARLTDNEKECLHRRLRQQTAKEMALELGVSPHAVEKRLKMARTKLGLSSSLEAARLLVASERYHPTGPEASDLASSVPDGHNPAGPRWLAGGILMTLAMTAAFAFALRSSGGVDADAPHGWSSQPVDRGEAGALVPGNVSITRPEISAIVQANFMNFDADGSGFLEGEELVVRVVPWSNRVYRRDESDKLVSTGETIVSEERARADFYSKLDRDGDVRVSFAEYFQWSTPRLARHGIPASLKQNMNRPILPDG